MNIYLLRQSRHEGYETYDSCVVAAANEDEARKIHPSGSKEYYESDWAKSNEIEVTLIGKAHKKINEPGVICASFNAG